ncbi:DarT ssDNA thymidine ADP-ribosyltransferase family protein [Intestinibacter sp.]
MSNNYEIKKFIQERNITNLYHFTPIDNLNNILKYGLLSIDKLEEYDVDYYYNDEKRYDNRLDAICTSISFPNYKMFFKCRQGSEDEQWCVIELDSKVLLDKNCIFYIENAASNNEKYRPFYDKIGIRGLEALFSDDYLREELDLPPYFTTNPQAEVQILDSIEVKYIKGLYFKNYCAKNLFDINIGYKYRNINSKVDGHLFKYRHDFAYWQSA